METKLGVYKRSKEIELTNLNKRMDFLQRSMGREGQVVLSGPCDCTEVLIYDFLNYSNVNFKKMSDRRKENEEEWVLWICSLYSVP